MSQPHTHLDIAMFASCISTREPRNVFALKAALRAAQIASADGAQYVYDVLGDLIAALPDPPAPLNTKWRDEAWKIYETACDRTHTLSRLAA